MGTSMLPTLEGGLHFTICITTVLRVGGLHRASGTNFFTAINVFYVGLSTNVIARSILGTNFLKFFDGGAFKQMLSPGLVWEQTFFTAM